MLEASLVQIEAQMPTADLRVAVDSCSAALGMNRCFAEIPERARGQDYWRARVAGNRSDSLTWRIEFSQGDDPTSLRAREIHFIEADAPRERWMTVGVVVAAHVVAALAESQRKPLQFPPEVLQILRRQELSVVEDKAPVDSPPGAPANSAGQWFLGAGFAAGVLPEQRQSQWGPLLNLQRRFAFPLGLGAQVSYLSSASGPTHAELWNASAGAGFYFSDPGGAVSAQLSAQVAFQRAFISVDDAVTESSQTQSVSRWGPAADLMGSWSIAEHLAVGLGVQFAVLRPALTLTSRQRELKPIGSTSVLAYLTLAALAN